MRVQKKQPATIAQAIARCAKSTYIKPESKLRELANELEDMAMSRSFEVAEDMGWDPMTATEADSAARYVGDLAGFLLDQADKIERGETL